MYNGTVKRKNHGKKNIREETCKMNVELWVTKLSLNVTHYRQ